MTDTDTSVTMRVDTSDSRISEDFANQEFDRFAEAMDLDFDDKTVANWDEDDQKGFLQNKRRFVGAVMKGNLTVNDNGEPVYTSDRANGGKPITFYEPTGGSMQAMDQKKKGHDVTKMYATMGDMTKTSAKTFSLMYSRDLKVCTAVAVLFLA